METLTMVARERRRAEILSRVSREEISLVKAAELMDLEYRQAKRLWAKYQKHGDGSLVHGLRGRVSNRQASPGLREQALDLFRRKYSDYGVTLAAECLAKEDGVIVPAETLRGWLKRAGLLEPRRKRKAHRRRRERRALYGEMVQMDGSWHDWFEGRRAWATLMVMIDDATSAVYAQFFEKESWHSSATIFQSYATAQGLPRALYVDRASIYRENREPTPDEVFAGKEPKTQFGRAMEELGVELILAHSAQAKGRVERMNGTLQDRLVKALRRAAIGDLESANRFLTTTFLPEFNSQFERDATKKGDLHRSIPAEVDFPRVLSIQESRVVQNDWTVQWHNCILQLTASTAGLVQPKQKVTVCQQLDGLLRIFTGDQELSWTTHREHARATPKKPEPRGVPTGSSQGQKPSANHPWRTAQRTAPSTTTLPAVSGGVGLDRSAPVAALPALRSPTSPPRKPR